jgi:hypothetical protein
MSDSVGELVRDIDRLLGRMRAWSVSAWQASPRPGVSRAERAARLARELAALGRRAGSGAPDSAELPRLADHALADQVAVLADDLLTALRDPTSRPDDWEDVAREARTAVLEARADLDPPHRFR